MRIKHRVDRERFNSLSDHFIRLYGILMAIEHYTILRWQARLTVVAAGDDWVEIDKSPLNDRNWKQVLQMYHDELYPADGDRFCIRDSILIQVVDVNEGGSEEEDVCYQ